MSVETIIKSDGSRVPFDPEKLNKWAQFASDNDVSWSDITLKAIRKCYDGCSTKDIHQAMIDVCVEQEDNKHLRMAGRLLIGIIYKEAHGGYSNIPTLTEFYKDMVQRNLWTSMDYSDEELEFLNKHLDHSKNISELYSYTALKQMRDKYLGQDLISKQCYESPQFMFMGCAMQAMEQQPKERRLEDIVKTYEYLSDLKINLSTPMLVNLRTPMKGLASCCVYTAGDTAPSLSVGDHIAYMMTCASAGIGSHLLTRSKGDPVRQGAVVHQGKLPYYKVIQSAVHANKQACYDDKTLVLTNTGFKLFSELNDDDLVAQVHDDGTVDFIEPIEGFVYDVDGELVTFTDENGNSLWVTDNHKMVVMDTSPIDPEDFHGDDTDEIPLFSMIEAGELELDNKLKFKLSADTKVNNSDAVSYTDYLLVLVKTFGIEDGKVILPEYSVEFEDHVYHLIENIDGVGYDEENIELILSPELLKVLNSKQETLLTRLGRNQLRELLNYMLFLAIAKDGWRDVADIQFFQEIASISGLVVQVRDDSIKIDEEQTTIVPTTSFTKGVVEYTGKVFCVEVPTNRLIVKRDDLVMVCGNSRGGANTTYFSVLDPEIDDLLVLKNPTTVLQKRIRDIDYAVNVNRLFVEKVARNEEWLTISYFHAKDLYDAFYSSDYEKFKELYESYLDHPKAKIHKARDIAIKMLTESVETGRIYVTYIDEANRHTPFRTGEVLDDGSIDRIHSSNLCNEVFLITKEFTNMQDLYSDEPFGEIGLCSLSSIVQGRVTDEEYEDVAYYTLLFVDNTLEIMDYPFPSLRRTARARRNIGIGMTNLAHDIASRGLSYTTQEGKKYIHYVSERHAYYLYKASLQLAKEKGIAEWMYKTKYPQGWLPIDTYNRNVDDVVPNDLHFDWEELRQGIIEMGGIRNSTVTAVPPNESSSLLTNTTNSIYPIRSLRVIKTSGTGRNILLAPDYEKLKNKYDIVWDMDMKDVIDLYAIVQKFTDQGISSDLYVSYQDSDTISTREILSHFIYMMKMGCKSRYYINSQAGVDKALYNRGEVKTEVIDVSDQCDSCVL